MKIEWASLGWAVVGGICGAIAVAISTAATYGSLNANVNSLTKKVESLEKRMATVEKPKVAKGDICLNLIRGLENPSDFERRSAEIAKQLQKFNCYEGVAASMNKVEEE